MFKRDLLLLFISTFLIRMVFKYFSGYSNFELFGDSVRYDILSERILAGNHDLDFIAFIISPLYPYTLAFFKSISVQYWEEIAVLYQFLLISISTVCICKISDSLFQDKLISLFSGIIYVFYPMTLFYNFTLSQETTFQAYFIIASYFFIRFLEKRTTFRLVMFSVFFALSFLTKSHILMFAPWVLLLIFYDPMRKISWYDKCKHAIIVSLISMIFTIPDGLKNYHIHQIYTLSGTGVKTFFHNGNSQENYDFVFNNVGLYDDNEMQYLFDTTYHYKGLGRINALPHKVKQEIHFDLAIHWIKKNPIEFLKLKLYSVIRFFAPGVSYSKYSFKIWIFSFISSAPIFFLAYFAIYKIIKKGDFFHHLFLIFLIANMFLFYIIFMPQTRFRAITLEPFYIIYASYGLITIIRNLSYNNHFTKTILK